MYIAENNECKFGKAIPLPLYHHVHQVGDPIWRIYIYIKMIIYEIYIAFSEIFHELVPCLYDTAYINRDFRRPYIRGHSKTSLKLLNENIHIMWLHSEDRFGRKGSWKYKILREFIKYFFS